MSARQKSGLFRLLGLVLAILLFYIPASAAEALTDAERVALIEQRYKKGEISRDIYLMLKNKYSAEKQGVEKKGFVIYGFDTQDELEIEPGEAKVKTLCVDVKERYRGRGALKCVVDYPSKWSSFSLSDFKNTPAIDDANIHPSIWMKADPKFDPKIFYVIEDRDGEWFRGVLLGWNRSQRWFRYFSKEPISKAEWFGMKEGADTSNINAVIDYPVKLKKLIICSRVPVEDVTFYLDELCVFPRQYVEKQEEIRKKGEYFYFQNIWNLVPNAGFEHSGTDGVRETIANWDSRDNCWSLDESNIHGGKTALKVNNTPGSSRIDSRNLSNINYVDKYQLTGWARIEKAKSLQLGMRWYRFDTSRGAHSDAFKEMGISWSKPIKGTSDWQQLTLSTFPPKGARWVSFCIKADTGEGTAWIDDLEFDGFGAAPVQIIESQAGYAPWSRKEIIVRTKEPASKGSFRLIDAKTGKEVFSGELKSFGKYTWERYNFIADISSFRKQGEYMLEAAVKDIGKAMSHKFRIKKGLYSDLAQKGLEYCYIQRCGMAIPGWHGACHLDDAVGKDENGNEIRIALSGGWHDASDYSKQGGGDSETVWALSVLQENLAPDWHRLKDKLPDPLAEAWWGTDFLLKRHLGNSRYIVGTIGFPDLRGYAYIPPEENTDNIHGTGDERNFGQIQKGDVPPYLHALAKYAQAVRPFDKEKYERCMAVITDLYEKHHQKYADAPLQYGQMSDYVILQLSMCKLDPKNSSLYRKRAHQGIENILRRMREHDRAFILCDRQKVPYCAKPGKAQYYWHYGCAIYNFVEAFQRYSEAFPDDEIVPALKKEVRWFMETAVIPLTSRSPYGQTMYFDLNNPVDILPNRRPDGTYVHNNWTTGYNQYLAKISRVCSLAAELLNEPGYLDIAERQIQWIMGRNPRRICMMGGVGYREMYCSSRTKSNPKIYHDASMPGGVVIGLGAGCPRPRHATASWDVHPEGFPCYGGEVWQHSTDLTILACQELEYARKHYFPDN